MEPICRIRTTPTREMDRQAYWPLLFHAKKSKFRFWLYNILIPVWLVGTAPMLFWIDMGILWIGFVILYGWMLYQAYRLIFQARLYAKAKEKERKDLVGDRFVQTELLFYEDHFCFHSAVSDSKYEHSYSAISDLKETKDYYVIFIKGNPAMVFAKKGETEGSPEQALALLRGNGSIPT